MNMNKKERTYMAQFLSRYIISIVISVGMICISHFLIIETFLNMVVGQQNDFSVGGIIMTQISVTFIVVSLIGVFSSSADKIYWTDIITYQLINPPCINFIALSAYLFAELTISLVLVFFNSGLILVSFILSMILMMVLSYKMIGAYFGRKTIKNKLKKIYILEEKESECHKEKKAKLIEASVQGMQAFELEKVKENLELLYLANEMADYIKLIKYSVNNNPEFLEELLVVVPESATNSYVYINYQRIVDELIYRDSSDWIYRPIMSSILDAYITHESKIINEFIYSYKDILLKKKKQIECGLLYDNECILEIIVDLNAYVSNQEDEMYKLYSPDVLIQSCIDNEYRGLSDYLHLRQIKLENVYNTICSTRLDFQMQDIILKAIGQYMQPASTIKKELEKYIEKFIENKIMRPYEVEFEIHSLYSSWGDTVDWSVMGDERSAKIRELLKKVVFMYPDRALSVFDCGK